MSTFKSAVKIARRPGECFNLTKERLSENAARRICTSLVLDTNILLGISNYMGETGDTPCDSLLTKYNLTEFVVFCSFCQENRIPFSISPGFCMPEVSPDSFDLVRERFDAFFPMHGLHVLDDPAGRHASPILQVHNILALPAEETKLRALPFLNVCAMLIADAAEVGVHPWAKFERFIELINEYIGLFSEKELAVAKVVLADMLNNDRELLDKEGVELITNIQNNFARTKKKKKPKTSEEALRIAFNAANDFTMINVAVERDGKPLDGIPMDVWMISNDAKLINYLALLFGYCVLVPGQTGMFAEISIPKGFDVALLPYDAKVFSHRVHRGSDRSFARLDSDLWITRVKEMIQLVNRVFPRSA